MLENGICGGDTVSHMSEVEQLSVKEKRKITFRNKTDDEREAIRQKNSAGVSKYIAENKIARIESAKKIRDLRKANGNPWHSDATKEKISKHNKSSTNEVREKISKTLTGRKNPDHSSFMKGRFVGENHPGIRKFTVISPDGTSTELLGCNELTIYCKTRNLPLQRMMSHINTGKIINTSTRGPSSVKNCVNYEIREIKNAKI